VLYQPGDAGNVIADGGDQPGNRGGKKNDMKIASKKINPVM
jgi:hypothetical protein